MKKLVVTVVIMFVAVVMCAWFILYDNYVTDALVQEYDNAGNVQTLNCTAVAKTDSTVTLQDEQGWLWQVEDDTITVGDDAIVWLVDNGTANDPTDDRVVYTVRVTQ